MKKIILSVIAIPLIAGIFYVASETPAAAPFLVAFGLLAGITLLGFALYMRIGERAESRRNFKARVASMRRRREAATTSGISGDSSPVGDSTGGNDEVH